MVLEVVVAKAVLSKIMLEANASYPLETGGILLGNHTGSTVEVKAFIGPGPRSKHARRSFEPDTTWQNAEMSSLYEASGRTLAYIGDWHTHPDATTPGLSHLDRIRLSQLANFSAARLPDPLMGICHGSPDNWALGLHKLKPRTGRFWRFVPTTEPVSWKLI